MILQTTFRVYDLLLIWPTMPTFTIVLIISRQVSH